MNKLTNILWGLFFVALAIIIGLNSVGLININLFFDGWWTVFIIVPSFLGLLKESDKTAPLIFLIVGVVLLLGCQGLLDFEIIKKLTLPAVLLVIGLSIIFKETISSKLSKKIKELNKQNLSVEDISAVFSGQEVDLKDTEFKGANINAVFGGVKLSLEEVKINEDIVINTCSVFGGIDIKVPNNVNIEIKSTSIFGGVDRKVPKTNIENAKTIYINSFNLFGGLDVK